MTSPSEAVFSGAFEFGPFRLIPAKGLLLDGDVACPLGSRALDILIALVEHAGQAVTKQALLSRAWPDTFVHEANLRVHVAALRKVLGDGQGDARYIVNVMGRGYCFVASVRRLDLLPEQPAVPAEARQPQHNLPAALTRPIGRGKAIENLALEVPARRCVTIAGPGGIGKTTVAVAVADRLRPAFDDGVWFIDLAAIMDSELIPAAIAAVLGRTVPADPLTELLVFLSDKRLLLLIDNCEHLIEAVAALAERILAVALHAAILATSREPLRVAGEWVHRLGPLGVPPEGQPMTAAEALEYPAMQLFVECASANLEGFTLRDADVAIVANICRRLDGLPLAIELAAARIDLFGLRGLEKAVGEQFLLLTEGKRAALPHQQNLLRTLEWSYRLLSSSEQTILRRLTVFAGDFTLEGAIAVGAGDGIEAEQVYSGILTLSAKSLITTDVSRDTPHYYHRLLLLTRAFVAPKLEQAGESNRIRHRHAEYLLGLFADAEADWATLERVDWIRIYGRFIDDVRAAIDWAFSADGDAGIGVALTAASVPLGVQLALIDEFRSRIERALLHAGHPSPQLTLAEMRLNLAHLSLIENTRGPLHGPLVGFERALELAGRFDNPVYLAEPLLCHAIKRVNAGDYAAAVELSAKALDRLEGSDDQKAILNAKRVSAQARHFNGDRAAAQRFARELLDHGNKRMGLAYHLLTVDWRVSMRIILARIAWIEGRQEDASRLVAESIGFAQLGGVYELCHALALAAIPIALWRGDDPAAGELIATLLSEAKRYSLGHWLSWGSGFRALLQMRAGERVPPPELVGPLQLDTFATFSIDLLTPSTSHRADSGACGWCQPEILRAQGEWLLAERVVDAKPAAEARFQKALETARAQGSLAWELRAAMSLARLWRTRERVNAARALLAEVLGGFRQGQDGADVREAAKLLRELAPQPGMGAPKRPSRTRSVVGSRSQEASR
jgi:predicted ATPase/DNA-binding winged helix-turn-helix (wHTH) protein